MAFNILLHFELIKDLISKKHYEKALLEIELAITHCPDFIQLYILEAVCKKALSQDKAAIDSLLKALALEPQSLKVHQSLALFYHEINDYPNADKHIQYCLEEDENDPDFLALASIIYRDKKPFKAERFLKKAESLEPDNEIVKHANVASSYLGFQLKKIKKILIENMSKTPHDPISIAGMGIVELSNWNLTDATYLLKKSYSLSPNEEVMDALIDAEISKTIPFRWYVPLGWPGYLYGVWLQLPFFVFFMFLAFLAIDKHPSYLANWLPYLLIALLTIASPFYLLKYPFQYIYRRIKYPDTKIINSRDLYKLPLFISCLCFWILIFNFSFSLLVFSVFVSIYIPIWGLVEKQQSLKLKSIMILTFIISWLSCFFIISSSLLNIENYSKWIELPAIFGWIMLIFLDEKFGIGIND